MMQALNVDHETTAVLRGPLDVRGCKSTAEPFFIWYYSCAVWEFVSNGLQAVLR
jgi:hypothetical protein